MIKLTVVMGPDTGNVFLQNDNPIVIGRNNDCDVVLHDGAVSRRHCVIETRGAAFIVSDLRSPNGLFLNDPKNRIDSHARPLPSICSLPFWETSRSVIPR